MMTNANGKNCEQHMLLVLEKPNREEFDTLLQREATYLSSVSKIPFQPISSRQTKWRPRIFEWFYKIIDHFEYDREVVAIAMDLLDRFQLLYSEEVDGEIYQRAAMASLYIAIKMNCSNAHLSSRSPYARRVFCLEEYAELSRGQFTANDLTDMELLICKTLDWKLNPVIPTYFLVKLLSVFPNDANTSSPISVASRKRHFQHPSNLQFVLTVLYELARYLIEIAVTAPEVSFYLKYESNLCNAIRPSSVCYAAILLSIDMVSESHLSLKTRNTFSERSSLMLKVNTEEVQRLKRIIQLSFIPTKVLDGSLSHQEVSMEIEKLHPFAILREAGILCLQSKSNLVNSLAKDNRRMKRKHPSSPTSLLDQEIFQY